METPPRTITWIASYPKSGNTWIRFMICNLVFGRLESGAEMNRLAPDIHRMPAIPRPPALPTLFKTHHLCSPKMPLWQSTAAAVYIVRDPMDILLSNYNYHTLCTDFTKAVVQPTFDHYVDEFIKCRGDPRWLAQNIGSWEENVRSWLGTKHDFPLLSLRYETMLADPVTAARQISQFLNLGKSEEEILRAADNSSFERMRQVEEADINNKREGIFYLPHQQTGLNAGLRFMRSGKAGQGAQRLSPAQRQKFADAFGPVMREFGFGSPA